jgi:ArsR family transcriptional regulator, arsenate/arsenite/antimonite-responsive transcriptional repressor
MSDESTAASCGPCAPSAPFALKSQKTPQLTRARHLTFLAGRAIVNRRLTMNARAISATEPAARTDETACCPPEDARAVELLKAPVNGPVADDELAAFAKAIGHPMRVRILRMLAKKEARMCSHIVDELPLAQSTVSEHLRILRSAGLVRANENGPRVSYCIVPSALKRMKALLEAV